MPNEPQATHDESIGYIGAVSIGIGGMVGGGIFSVLGLAVGVGKGATFLAFLVAGLVALVTTYSYARLSVAYPSEGGTVEFLDQAFGAGRFAGSLNVLLWLSYIVTTSLYAYAFGSYGATFLPDSAQGWGTHALITFAVLSMGILNIFGARLISATENWIVAAKITILVAFVVAALFDADFGAVAPSKWAGPGSIVAGGMLIFVAYEGFELIANAAADVRDPALTLPRALYSSVVFAIVLYMLVGVVTVGLLSLDEITSSQDFALAEAAEVIWGSVGFDLIVIAALLSTASAINATLYGTARLSVRIAVDGELPGALEHRIAGKPLIGLFVTAGAALLMANFFPLEAISGLASSGFLIVFAGANLANVRLARRTNSRRWISILGVVACLGALGALITHTAAERPLDLVMLAGLLIVTFVGEATYQHRRRLHDARLATATARSGTWG